MRFWKKREERSTRKGILSAALQGASHEELVQEVLNELVLSSGADRIGVWIEASTAEGVEQESVFQGVTWDRESESTPREWRTLSPQAVLPVAQLLSGLTLDANAGGDGSQPLVGPVAGLQNAFWVPVQHAGKLRGILLAGTHGANRELPKEQVQSVAMELTVALALETERKLAVSRYADIALCNRILASLQEESAPEDLLRDIVESCVAKAGHPENPGASFAFIGRATGTEEGREDAPPELSVMVAAAEEMVQRFAGLETVRELAWRALKTNQTVGNEVSPRSSGERSLQVIAMPLRAGGKECTVLVAGIRATLASLGTLERMELRGRLAASVLSALREGEDRAQQRQRERAILESTSNPIVLLGPQGELYRDLTAQRSFHAKLLQTERLAALGQMVSGVAHELSNPLTSILGYAQRLLLRSEAGGHFEEIRRIFAEAERAGAILRRMLLSARESGPERKPVPLNPIIQRTIDLQRFSLAAERIRVEAQLGTDLPQVVGDAGQLQQILMNLLGNARQAIEAQGHGGTIRVRTQRTEDNRIRLEVSDSGPGIPEGIMARIFDPFFTTKPAGVGTGLGLSIVLSLVREHGGQVHVSSPQGSGAVFVVELPAAEQKELQGREAAKREYQPNLVSQERRSFANANKRDGAQRVLVVEDEPTVAQLISDVLGDEGFEIEILLDGTEAAERVLRESFDLIICDMKMPNLDGQSLYESLLPAKKFLQKRFLFVTGDVLGAKTHEFLTKNELPYVAKPFRMEELLEKVHQVLEPAGSIGPRRTTPLRRNRATTG